MLNTKEGDEIAWILEESRLIVEKIKKSMKVST